LPSAELEADAHAAPRGVAAIGALALGLLRTGGEIYSVFVKTLYYSVRGVPQPGAVMRQAFEIGNRSLGFLAVVMGFLGMIFVYQSGLQVQRVVPDLSLLGATYLEILVRELAPTITALMLATRVGAGIAAEIGSMVVTEQVDALRLCAADPVDYLLKPRFLASLLMTAVLAMVAGSVAWLTGMATAQVFFSLTPATYANFSLVDAGDVVTAVLKCIAYGAAVPVVSGHSGLATFGGSEGVGWATTRAVVNSSAARLRSRSHTRPSSRAAPPARA
jgi:phospholipid/cholesterol/gamma-HCH transport system permease protein